MMWRGIQHFDDFPLDHSKAKAAGKVPIILLVHIRLIIILLLFNKVVPLIYREKG